MGPLSVARVEPAPGPVTVYNLEVHGSHVYHVTRAGVLVHNANTKVGYIYEITYYVNG